KLGTNSGLSGGEIKRLKLLKHLLSKDMVLIWDEPFDGIQVQLVKKIILDMKKTNTKKRIFIIDHNILTPNEADSILNLERDVNGLINISMEKI
ncbi:MAG: hypothetical protein VW522_11875, partial [Candidatus Neomarinimicrobiota bacterium]